MRRDIFRSDRTRAIELLERAPYVHLAGVVDGKPIAKTVHVVIVGDRVCFHAAPAGEKMSILGSSVVLFCEEVVAEVPSYFMDPVRACPATTLYESVQVHGVLERIDDVDTKAAVLQSLMKRFQPEGGHAPIDPHDPRYAELYASAVRGLLIAGVKLDDVDCKSKLAQNRSADDIAILVDKLWQRGSDDDARAVDLILGANPKCATPAFLRAPAGVTFRAALDDAYADDAALLLHDAYWNAGVSRADIAHAHRHSSAWVGAIDGDGALVASARALADGAKWATLYDVIVRSDVRGRGIGTALVRLLLDHPRVRRCRKVHLRTRDAQGVYAKLGFQERAASSHTEMLLARF